MKLINITRNSINPTQDILPNLIQMSYNILENYIISNPPDSIQRDSKDMKLTSLVHLGIIMQLLFIRHPVLKILNN